MSVIQFIMIMMVAFFSGITVGACLVTLAKDISR